MSVLAIDQGTTSTKGFLLHPDGGFEPVGQHRHAQSHPGPGLVEHDAAEILAHVEALIDAALAACPGLAAVALANQGETVVAWERTTGRPLAPAIVWQDQRTADRLAALPLPDREAALRLSGLPLDPYFSASKLAWLLDHAPGARALAADGRLGLATTDVFLIERLTGAYATDPTTASRTGLMGLESLAWEPELCHIFGVPLDLMPRIGPTTGRLGLIQRGGRVLPLTASIVDQQAALWGHGCRAPGDLKITFGTGSFALALTGPAPDRSDPGLVPTVAWALPGGAPIYARDGGDYAAAAAVEWAASAGLGAAPEAVAIAAGPSFLERGLVFVPALAGLAAPHWDRAAAGAFLGLRLGTTGPELAQAVLEGVALRAVELIEALAPGSAAPVSADGGLTRNAGFVAFLADALGRPVWLRAEAELTALGLAELGHLGLGRAPPPRPEGGDRLIRPSPRSPALRAARPRFAAALAAVRGFGRA